MPLTERLIPERTREVAQLLSTSELARGYVLGGGTSIALHLAHRTSHDLDLLFPRSGSDSIAGEALIGRAATLVEPPEFAVSLRTLSQVDCTIHGVLVSWLGYPFEFVDPFEEWRHIKVLSLLDVSAVKAYTIGRRPAARDYVDLFYSFRSGVSMNSIVERAKSIFVLDGHQLFDEHLSRSN